MRCYIMHPITQDVHHQRLCGKQKPKIEFDLKCTCQKVKVALNALSRPGLEHCTYVPPTASRSYVSNFDPINVDIDS